MMRYFHTTEFIHDVADMCGIVRNLMFADTEDEAIELMWKLIDITEETYKGLVVGE